MTSGGTPAVSTAAWHDSGSTAVTLRPRARLRFQLTLAGVCNGVTLTLCPAAGCVLHRSNMPPAPVGVTFNYTVTAGMCRYPAASGPFLPAVNAEPVWNMSFLKSCDVKIQWVTPAADAAVTGARWESPVCLPLSVCLLLSVTVSMLSQMIQQTCSNPSSEDSFHFEVIPLKHTFCCTVVS